MKDWNHIRTKWERSDGSSSPRFAYADVVCTPGSWNLNVLDLFSGIGGFSLGLERAGMRTVAFCEIDPFCRKVLAKHWPHVPCYADVRTLTADRLRADGITAIDAICGGFPCQDISLAGAGAGLAGERSGLWREYARIIGELRPHYVVVENVAGLLSRGLGEVLGDLAALGYDAEWHCIPASAVGAPHRRDRLWIVAYAQRLGQQAQRHSEIDCQADRNWQTDRSGGSSKVLAYADSSRLEILIDGQAGQLQTSLGTHQWAVEPDVGRMAYGVSDRVDRLKGLGNAVVPQIPEIIGRAIMRAAA